MKKWIITVILVLVLVVAMGLSFMPATEAKVPAASDKVTMPDPNWPTPEQVKTQEILEQMLENKH